MRKKRRSSCVRITKHLLFYATSVLPIPASRFSPSEASGPIPNRGRRTVSKGEEDTLSCFLFLYQCICVGQPSILLAFSFLEMRGPMFRWSGRFLANSPPALSGGLQALPVVHQSRFGFPYLFLRKSVAAANKKSVFAEYREVDLKGGFLLSDGLFLL